MFLSLYKLKNSETSSSLVEDICYEKKLSWVNLSKVTVELWIVCQKQAYLAKKEDH